MRSTFYMDTAGRQSLQAARFLITFCTFIVQLKPPVMQAKSSDYILHFHWSIQTTSEARANMTTDCLPEFFP